MGYAPVNRIDVRDIPVIDIGGLRTGTRTAVDGVAAEMLAAAEHLGFFYVRGHGVEPALLTRAEDAARRFFALPQSRKLEVAIDHRHRGFLRVGEATMEGNRFPDLKESFVWGLEVSADDPAVAPGNPFLGPNNWPAFMPELAAGLMPFFAAGNELGRMLLRTLAVAVGAPEGAFDAHFDYPISRGAAVFYPPQAPELGAEQFGVGEHTDYGCMTVLCQDPIGGLEVRDRAGNWIVAEPIAETFVINVGDLLARWTDDRFTSTPHRVVNRTGRERLSLAVFVDPDFETVIDPAVVRGPGETPRYPPVRCGDYILSRYDGAFAYRQPRP